jgi:hypothetical protein
MNEELQYCNKIFDNYFKCIDTDENQCSKLVDRRVSSLNTSFWYPSDPQKFGKCLKNNIEHCQTKYFANEKELSMCYKYYVDYKNMKNKVQLLST